MFAQTTDGSFFILSRPPPRFKTQFAASINAQRTGNSRPIAQHWYADACSTTAAEPRQRVITFEKKAADISKNTTRRIVRTIQINSQD